MSEPLRILHLADSHIGASLPRRPRSGRPSRGEDFVRSYRQVLQRARDHHVDLVIHAGDVFDTPRPTSTALALAANPLLELAASGTRVVVVPGNHERSAVPATLLLAHENVTVVRNPTTQVFCIRGSRVAVSAIPCIRRRSAEQFPGALDATGWQEHRADVRLLCVHQAFESARCGPANYSFRSGEDVIARDAVPDAFDYVAAGHVHRHQVLEPERPGAAPIVYAGSSDRITFAERGEPKGCVLIEVGGHGLGFQFFEHAVRPMSIVPIDVTGMDGRTLQESVRAAAEDLQNRAVGMLRLTGRTMLRDLRGLRLTQLARQVRPDALITISSRAVERGAQCFPRGVAKANRSVFSHLRVAAESTRTVNVAELRSLPRRRGVYALCDSRDRLLYVGQAANLRARLQTHARGSGGVGFFDGWTRQIATLQACVLHSELEALLVEASLIASLRPPFNRQMRRWMDYCYICQTGTPHGQLEVRSRPNAGGPCYGPYRSRFQAELIVETIASHFKAARCPRERQLVARLPAASAAGGARLCERYFDGRCSGPCADRVSPEAYVLLLRKRHDVLSGADDSTIVELETLAAEKQAQGIADELTGPLLKQVQTLRGAFDHSVALRSAEQLLDGILLLPSAGSARTVAVLSSSGLDFQLLAEDEASAERVLQRHRALRDRGDSNRVRRLARSTFDAMGLVARHLQKDPMQCRYVSAVEARVMTPADLLQSSSLLASSLRDPVADSPRRRRGVVRGDDG